MVSSYLCFMNVIFFQAERRGGKQVSYAVPVPSSLKVLPYHLPVSVYSNIILPDASLKALDISLSLPLQGPDQTSSTSHHSPAPLGSPLDCHNQHTLDLPNSSFSPWSISQHSNSSDHPNQVRSWQIHLCHHPLVASQIVWSKHQLREGMTSFLHSRSFTSFPHFLLLFFSSQHFSHQFCLQHLSFLLQPMPTWFASQLSLTTALKLNTLK